MKQLFGTGALVGVLVGAFVGVLVGAFVDAFVGPCDGWLVGEAVGGGGGLAGFREGFPIGILLCGARTGEEHPASPFPLFLGRLPLQLFRLRSLPTPPRSGEVSRTSFS